MKVKSLILATALVVVSGLNGAIAAPTPHLVDWSAQGNSNDANVYASGYSAYLNPTWSWAGGASPFVSGGNFPNSYQSPFNTVQPETDNVSYFAVGGGADGNGEVTTPVTLLFNKALSNDTFKMLWGSIDTYNSVAFYDGGGLMGVINGIDIINAIVGAGNYNGGANSELVALLTFTGVAGATHAVFSSTSAALEFALAPVPIPPALLLFGTALAGMGLLSRRRRQTAA